MKHTAGNSDPLTRSTTASDDLHAWAAHQCPYGHIARIEYEPVKGTRRKVLGDVLGEAFDNDPAVTGKKGPRSPTKPLPPRIDGAYLVVLEWQVAGVSGHERWCALRNQGGGIEFAWQLNPGDNWREIAREIVQPD